MREIELKAHANDYLAVKDRLEAVLGEGRSVSKNDTYLIDSNARRLRLRNKNGSLEATVKKTRKSRKGDEDNLEYELHLRDTTLDEAIAFFSFLGYRFHFNKHKTGWDWNYEGVHIELLEVNDLGWFLEMEGLLPFDSEENEVIIMREKLHSLLSVFGLEEKDIENKSYREMILKEVDNGI